MQELSCMTFAIQLLWHSIVPNWVWRTSSTYLSSINNVEFKRYLHFNTRLSLNCDINFLYNKKGLKWDLSYAYGNSNSHIRNFQSIADKNLQRFGQKDLRLIFLWHEINSSFATSLIGNLVVYRMYKRHYFASLY